MEGLGGKGHEVRGERERGSAKEERGWGRSDDKGRLMQSQSPGVPAPSLFSILSAEVPETVKQRWAAPVVFGSNSRSIDAWDIILTDCYF